MATMSWCSHFAPGLRAYTESPKPEEDRRRRFGPPVSHQAEVPPEGVRLPRSVGRSRSPGVRIANPRDLHRPQVGDPPLVRPVGVAIADDDQLDPAVRSSAT